MRMEDLLRGELIGFNIKVIGRDNKGKIIDETKNSFIIESNGKRKRVLKKNNIIEFNFNNKKITINGNELLARPEDRIKK